MVQVKKQTFSANFKSLAIISDFVGEVAQSAGFDENNVFEVQLAVDEACSNIIEHAYGDENQGDIECICEISKGILKIVLEDQGKAFNPKLIPEPDYSVTLQEVSLRGAGMKLIRKIMDEVNYSFSDKDGNRLVMIKRI